jgi:hypothetical protein
MQGIGVRTSIIHLSILMVEFLATSYMTKKKLYIIHLEEPNVVTRGIITPEA